jgi:hypothetical protein
VSNRYSHMPSSSAIAGSAAISTTAQDMQLLTYSMFVSAAEVSAADLLASIAESIANIADAPAPGGGCRRATKVAIAFYNGLLIAAPGAAPAFAVQIGIQVLETGGIHHVCQCPVPNEPLLCTLQQ